MKILFNIAIMALVMLLGFEALAQTPPTPDPNKIIQIPNICDGVIKPNRMSGNVVRCVEEIIDERADDLIDGMVADYSFIVFHVVILAVVLFFIRVMFGVARARGIISMFAAKVVLVLFIANPESSEAIKDWRDAITEFPKDISLNILDAVDSPITASQADEAVDVFDMLDLYVFSMLGVDESQLSDDQNNPSEIYVGIAALIAAILFTGSVGAAVSAISVGFLIALIVAMAEITLFFCTIIVAINFLAAIAPIAVSCILFQPTKKICSMWFQYCIIYVVQPILLMAGLGLFLAVLSGVIGQFEDKHEKIKGKLENQDGNSMTEVSLFDCSNLSIPMDKMMGAFNSQHMMGQVLSQTSFAQKNFDRYSRGLTNPGQGGFSSGANLTFGGDCKITAPAMKLNSYDQAYELPPGASELDQAELKELMGMKIGLTVLMMMMISFMIKLPQMVNMMVGQGVIAELAKYATTPVKTAETNLFGKTDPSGKRTPGILENVNNSLGKSNTVKRN
jgi:hypothetical protein